MNQELTDSQMEGLFTKTTIEEETQKLASKVDGWIEEKIKDGLRNKGFVCNSFLDVQMLKSKGFELECWSKNNPSKSLYEDTYAINGVPFLIIIKNYKQKGLSLTAHFL